MRSPELVVISDLHLGTYGCHADELAAYLETVQPKTLVLNGDIIDFWYLNRRYWPKSHMRVLELIVSKASQGVLVYYLTGNHDDLLRRFSNLFLGNFSLVDKLVLSLNGKNYWFFHGDVLDATLDDVGFFTRFLTRLGGWGYDRLILINRFINKVLYVLGRSRVSLSKLVRANSKKAVDHLNRFESTLADLAVEKNYQGVICGHVHAPGIKELYSQKHQKNVLYLNSGDWVEHLTALEFDNNVWSLLDFSQKPQEKTILPDIESPVESLRSDLDLSL
ncbi:MAG: UDP-2,3-diacylglucosamine diphosphatase [Bdellovibrionota bacterium]